MSSIYRSCSPRRVAAPALVARSLTARVVYLHLLVGELAGQVPGIVRAGAGALAGDVGLEVGGHSQKIIKTFTFPATQFIAVTAYQVKPRP